MLSIRNLKDISPSEIVEAFESAFADYAVSFDTQELFAIWKRRGFKDTLSFATFEDNQKDGDNQTDEDTRIVGFTLNGIGYFNGILSAYDTGTGVVKAYRGQGLSKDIFLHALPYLKGAGVQQYVLEVMTDNEPAFAVYKGMGFEVSRTFNCYKCSDLKVLIHALETGSDTKLRDVCIQRTSVESVSKLDAFIDFNPSWQNSFESLIRADEDVSCLTAMHQGKVIGYCVFDPVSGDLSCLAVEREFRRQGIGSMLLKEMVHCVETDFVKCLNIDASCSEITSFLEKRSFELLCKQYEMILKI